MFLQVKNVCNPNSSPSAKLYLRQDTAWFWSDTHVLTLHVLHQTASAIILLQSAVVTTVVQLKGDLCTLDHSVLLIVMQAVCAGSSAHSFSLAAELLCVWHWYTTEICHSDVWASYYVCAQDDARYIHGHTLDSGLCCPCEAVFSLGRLSYWQG